MENGSHRIFRIVVLVLSAIGCGLSVEALRQHVLHTHDLASAPSFCDISAYVSCNAVNASEWSTFLGIPIASYGVFFYLALFGVALCAGARRALTVPVMGAVVLVSAGASVLVSIALLVLSVFVIKALCILCLGLYAVNVGLLAAAWWCVARGQFTARLRSGVQALLRFVGLAVAPAAVLAGRSGSANTVVSQARFGLFSLVAVGVFSWLLESLLLNHFLVRASEQAVTAPDYTLAWRVGEVKSIPVNLDGGALGDYGSGDVNAPIQIVEFADFECQGCRRMYGQLKEVLAQYQGRYHLVFKNYPLDNACNENINRSFHRFSCVAAQLSRCAGEQGKFWEALDWLFTIADLEQSGSVSEVQEQLVGAASAQLGLDAGALRECIGSERQLPKIKDDVRVAQQLGLNQTPTFWVNGKVVRPLSIEVLKGIFASIAAQK